MTCHPLKHRNWIALQVASRLIKSQRIRIMESWPHDCLRRTFVRKLVSSVALSYDLWLHRQIHQEKVFGCGQDFARKHRRWYSGTLVDRCQLQIHVCRNHKNLLARVLVESNACLKNTICSQENADVLDGAIIHSKDYGFSWFALQTMVNNGYLLRLEGKPVERCQHFWMRLAVGLWYAII